MKEKIPEQMSLLVHDVARRVSDLAIPILKTATDQLSGPRIAGVTLIITLEDANGLKCSVGATNSCTCPDCVLGVLQAAGSAFGVNSRIVAATGEAADLGPVKAVH